MSVLTSIPVAVSGAKKMSKNPTTHTVFSPDLDKHGEAYQDLASNNPYSDVEYRQSWIQKMLEKLGFRTNKDAYLESMALQAKEYDNAILQKEYDENYNSPLQQAFRESLAGLNPALQGDISAGEASPLRDDGNPLVAPVADDLQIVQGFASAVLSSVQTAFGLYGDLQSLRGLKLDNQAKRVANESNTMSLVKEAYKMIIPDIYENRNSLSDGYVNVDNYYNSLHRQFGNSMSRKQFKRFVDRVNAFANSAEGWNMLYSVQDSKAKNRKSLFKEIADPDQYSEWDDVMFAVSDEIASLPFDIWKKKSENDKRYETDVRPEELTNKEAYEQAFDPTTAAKIASNPADLSLKRNQVEMSNYQLSLRDSFRGIMSKLSKLEDKGNTAASIVKAIISISILKYIGQ